MGLPVEGGMAMATRLAARAKGLSEAEFREAFGTEEQCRAALEKLRWPQGFTCPACGHAWLAGRQLHQCNRCKRQVSLTAGTIFHATKLPLTLWFLAIHLIVTAKNGISSIELGRRLGIKPSNAWAMKQKIMQVMLTRETAKPLQGRVELDDAYLGGERSGTRGRGAAGKIPFVAAVETIDRGAINPSAGQRASADARGAERRPGKLKLLPIKGLRKREVERPARQHLASGATVVSDGLSCWTAVTRTGCAHEPMLTGSGRQAAKLASFSACISCAAARFAVGAACGSWVHTTLGNVKAAIVATCRQLSPAHAARYLASFAWRFNRRFQLDTMLPRFLHSAARTDPPPYQLLTAG
jgi:ISXO2-like transposase domain/Transposase zinc-ribbon domain